MNFLGFECFVFALVSLPFFDKFYDVLSLFQICLGTQSYFQNLSVMKTVFIMSMEW